MNKYLIVLFFFCFNPWCFSFAAIPEDKQLAGWLITDSDDYILPATVIGIWDKKVHRSLSFSSGSRKDLGGLYQKIGFLPKSEKAEMLVVAAVDEEFHEGFDRACNVNWFLFDLTKKSDPFTPGILKEICFDTVIQFGPDFYREGDKYVVHFSSSISERGERQPNVKYIYDQKSGQLSAEIKDTRTKKITHRIVQPPQ